MKTKRSPRDSLRERARDVSRATPADRNRLVDFLRAGSIVAVVIGHWLAAVVWFEDGRFVPQNALALLAWSHLLTWLFQVMPIFFLVGGFSNAVSWDSHQRRGGFWLGWVIARAERLLRPTTVFVLVVIGVVVAARAAGADAGTVDQMGWVAGIVLWFLALYLVVTAAAPAMLAVHRRWGLSAFAVLLIGIGLADLLRLGLNVPFVGYVNFILVWLALHHLGILWHEGLLTSRRVLPWAMALGGFGLLVGLTTIGPYPVSMVGVPGAEIANTSPPTVALLVLGIAQAGLVLALRGPISRWLERPVPWLVTVGVNRVVMTLYLWHMVPPVLAALLLYPSGIMPQPPVESAAWLLLRVPWIAVLTLLLVGLVAGFGRFERSRPPVTRGRPSSLASIMAGSGIGAASIGLLLFTVEGFHGLGPLGKPLIAMVAYASGILLLALASRHRRHGEPGAG